MIGQTYTGPSAALGDLTYSYDATGNRLTTGGSFARSGLPTAISASAYDAANQQLTFGSVAQTFDANGNLLTQTDATGTTTYTWDARNRLTALTGPTVNATFVYDALGRRTAKTIDGQSTSVLYDGLDIVQESGPEGDASYLRTLGIDEALSRTDANGTLTYLPDALGSTLALADSGGGLPTTYTYAPFGETSVSGLPASSPFQFTGRENDGTGLYYYRVRYYDPVRGRFVSEDPIGLVRGRSSYAYVDNRPLNSIDPGGLLTVIAGGGTTLTAPSGVDVSGGILVDLSSRPDIGGYLSGGIVGGVNVSADVFAGLIFGDVNTLRGLSTNTTLTVGPLTLTVLSDPTTGEIIGVTGGIGPPSPFPAGASISATPTAAITIRDVIDWLRKHLGKEPDPCKAPGRW